MLCRRGYKIDKSTCSTQELKELCKELTVTPINEFSNGFQSNVVSYKVFTQSEKFLYIPRFFRTVHESPSIISPGEIIDSSIFDFKGKLKQETKQIEAAEQVLKGLHEYGGGILSLPTGYGKTTVALYVLSKLKRKTIIVVHKEFLMNQWIERIQQFLPNVKIGKIQGPIFDVESKDIVIGMLQSLSMKDYDNRVFSMFGCTIIDETHHICTKTFSKMLLKFTTTYMLGLSATLERKDGLTKVIHWFLGPVLFSTERKHSDVELSTHTFKQTIPFPKNRMGNANMPEAINQLVDNQDRNTMIIDIILKHVLHSNRKILLLSDRRDHCIHIMYTLESNPNIQRHKKTLGLYLGGMKSDELKYSETCDVILGTYSLAHEGLDIPSLDTLIMATPKSNIIQSVGRILRETPGKQNRPKIIDIIDQWGPFYAQYKKRCNYYSQLGCHSEDTNDDDDINHKQTLKTFAFLED